MKYRILHESRGRIRVHLPMQRMTFRQADTLDYYLEGFPGIQERKVYERTADAVLRYSCSRDRVIEILRGFSFEKEQVPESVYESSGSEVAAKYREKIGMVFQSYDLFPHKTILENVMLAPLKVQKRKKDEVKKEAEQLLDRVGLLSKVSNYPRQLSGGQKQRVAIVRALIMHPEILLFDEVTAALDPEMVREVLDVILDLAKQQRTMLIVTHEMAFAKAIADRVIFLDGGSIVEDSDPTSFFTAPKTDRARKFLNTFEFEKVH